MRVTAQVSNSRRILSKILKNVSESEHFPEAGRGGEICGKILVVYFSLDRNESMCVHSHGLDRHKSLFQCFTVPLLLTMLFHEHVKDVTIPSPLPLNLLQFPWIFRALEITISCPILPPHSSCLLGGLEVGSDPGASKLTHGHFAPHCCEVVTAVWWSQFPN